MDSVAKEQWALAVLTAHFDCAQQKFFQAEYGRRRRSPSVALALCLTLGLFGAHEFYLGRLRSAALRLLFCWTLIPLLLALIEASFLTRRVHAYNTRMAHTLAEIVDETFAATRAQAEQNAQVGQANWETGVARTFEPAEAIRRREAARRTTPLAQERQATSAPDALLLSAPPSAPPSELPGAMTDELASDTAGDMPAAMSATPFAALPAPTPVASSHTISDGDFLPAVSRLRQTHSGASLDALLALLSTPAAAAPAPEPAALAQPAALPAPAPAILADLPVPAFADALDAAEAPAAPYAILTGADEPSPAIMVADAPSDEPPPQADETAPVEPDAPSQPAPRVQRIVVRKVALVDGHAIAEARATRDVVIPATDAEAQARIALATDEARAEAMRLLSALVPAETLALAAGA